MTDNDQILYQKRLLEAHLRLLRNTRSTVAIMTIVGCILLFVGAAYWYWSTVNIKVNVEDKKEFLGIVALFSLPLIFQIVDLIVLLKAVSRHYRDIEAKANGEPSKVISIALSKPPTWRFYLFCQIWVGFYLIIHTLTWIWYASGGGKEWGRWVALGCIIFLLLPAIGMTYTIMESPSDVEANESETKLEGDSGLRGLVRFIWRNGIVLKNMKSSVSTAPYWALLLFVAMFLIVNYLFSFAFAFDDRSLRSSSLGGNQPAGSTVPALYRQPLPRRQPPSSVVKKPYRFTFDSYSARLIEDQSHPENGKELGNLVSEMVINLKDGNRVILELKGQADDPPIDSRIQDKTQRAKYLSNYELSEARALRVKSLVLENLSDNDTLKNLPDKGWRNIEWHYVPMSNDYVLQSKDRDSEPDKRRSVEAALIAFKEQPLPSTEFSLMDYVIYTITGADFGDVVPTTPYAKFLTSFVNILQIFFVVALFSAIFTLQNKSSTSTDENKDTQVDNLTNDLLSKVSEPVCVNTTMVFPFNGGTGSVNVTVPDGARWKARVPPEFGWIELPPHSSGNSSRAIEYLVRENKSVNHRMSRIVIEIIISGQQREQVLTINQAGCAPILSISPTRKLFNANGDTADVKVVAPDNCHWEAESHYHWITFGSKADPDDYLIRGLGRSDITYTIGENKSKNVRYGKIIIAGHHLAIIQEKSTCSYTLSPLSQGFSNFASGIHEIKVTTNDGCQWEAESHDDWIKINSGKKGVGSGAVKYQVAENKTSAVREGIITVAWHDFKVYQNPKKPS